MHHSIDSYRCNGKIAIVIKYSLCAKMVSVLELSRAVDTAVALPYCSAIAQLQV